MGRLKILLLNPPHPSIGSRLAGEHLPPLGLLSIGGPLIDAGYDVQLLDADYSNMKIPTIIERIEAKKPDLLLMGHSGSTSAQPIINEIAAKATFVCPKIRVILGGVYPTYHYEKILMSNRSIEFVVCGEGEAIMPELIRCIEKGDSLENVDGIAFRSGWRVIKTKPASVIQDLDQFRIGWELMEGYHYTYWGKRKAVVIQFSRGCPYPCNYCGQSLFWKKWRNRDPQKLADEIEMLHRNYGVEVINFADENPSTNKREWKKFLECLIEKDLNLCLVGSIRADNIVRDAKHLHLYKKAGFERFLLGIENYDEEILKKIKKAGSMTKDMEAIRLLRKHNILSMATYVVGFGEEKTRDFYNSLKQLLKYDPDQIQMLYVTPHHWTPYFHEVKEQEIVQTDQTKWDYKHQVLKTANLHPAIVILYVKMIEVIMQMRPKAIRRWLWHKDKKLRKAMFWYNNIGKRVWFFELWQFFFRTKLSKQKITVNDYWKNEN